MKRVLYSLRSPGIPQHEFMASACETGRKPAIKCANTSVCCSKCVFKCPSLEETDAVYSKRRYGTKRIDISTTLRSRESAKFLTVIECFFDEKGEEKSKENTARFDFHVKNRKSDFCYQFGEFNKQKSISIRTFRDRDDTSVS